MRKLFLLATLAISLISACDDRSNVDLPPPPEGKGWHYETKFIEVPFGSEEQDCYFFQVPGEGTSPVYVKKIEVAQNPGSHHMNIFRVKTIHGLDPANGEYQPATNGVGECFNSPNWSDWPLVINSQSAETVSWELPKGVVHTFHPGDWLMLQTHYVNATTQTTPDLAHVEVNFWTTQASEVQNELGTLFATKQSIRVCQHNPAPTFEGSCGFNSANPVHIIGANAHFHSRGKQFNMFAWDGVTFSTPAASERFYRSTDWDHPPMERSPDLDLTIPAHGGVWYACSYQWKEPPPDVGCEGVNAFDKKVYDTPDDQLDCCYTFGGIVEKAEHCNIFVYYYPKSDDINCF